MEAAIKDFSKGISSMATVKCSGLMVTSIEAGGRMGLSMEKDSYSSLKKAS